jgi:hypothetical protein
MSKKKGLRQWLLEQRNASRLALLLQMGTRVLSSFMGMIWIRLLVGAMGQEMNSLFLAFQSVLSFGGLGDLGMGGAVGVRTGQYLGAGVDKEQEMHKFLAAARTVFLLIAVVVAASVFLTSPWQPHWWGFRDTPGAGSLSSVFRVGAFLMCGVLLNSYISNVNYACGNVTWPILPAFVLLQFSMVGHYLLASHHQPLWIQYLPYLASSIISLCLLKLYVQTSHPALARLWPLGFDWRMTTSLFESSVWIYLCTLGNSIYRNTDGMLINAHSGFKLGTLSYYLYNYKFCEIVVFVALTASFVTLPKITQWMASEDPKDHERVRVEMRKLNQFQALLGCGAALAYLAGNNLFMKIWWLHKANPILPAALPLQLAFALNLAVTTSGDAGIQLALRSGKGGLRAMGMVIGATGLLNLGLSFVAMKLDSLTGIAMATVLAQSVLSLVASRYVCRHLQMAWLPWVLKGWLAPLLGISLAAWLRVLLPMNSAVHISMLLGAYALMFAAAAWALGINAAFFKEEFQIVRKLIGK